MESQQLRDLGGKVIELPKLHHGTMTKIDLADASFWAAVNNPAAGHLSLMDRQRGKVWLKKGSAAIDEVLKG